MQFIVYVLAASIFVWFRQEYTQQKQKLEKWNRENEKKRI